MYTLEGCETAAQVAEEAQRAEILAPLAVVGSIVGSWIIGLAYMLALLFSVQSIPSIQASSYAIPIAQLYYDAVGQKLTLMCLTVVALAQFMAAVTAFTASVYLLACYFIHHQRLTYFRFQIVLRTCKRQRFPIQETIHDAQSFPSPCMGRLAICVRGLCDILCLYWVNNCSESLAPVLVIIAN